jgi:hypothetical protein
LAGKAICISIFKLNAALANGGNGLGDLIGIMGEPAKRKIMIERQRSFILLFCSKLLQEGRNG